ncbi:hypothetical protein C900_02218 [Fulvivirga imtechensis AK7]|uniref:DUF3575 domain-containing protein n=1 Tax=Fulvivirga imtechensis AK7 TaxID=1237149 RepID=L8JUC6_9BACT|nr:hypothetical protein C900_02218 [Fulvivirga imtechensis AK7]
MPFVKFRYILIFLLFRLNVVAQENAADVPSQHKFNHYLFTVNPLRAFVDEVTVNWELLNKDFSGHGFSLGYIYPSHLLTDIWRNIEFTDNMLIRAQSSGGLVKYYRVVPMGRKSAIHFLGQFKYYNAKDAVHVVGNHLSSGAREVHLDRQTLVYGLQFRYCRNYRIADVLIFSLYMGGGLNLFHNVYTEYHYYYYGGVNPDVPVEYRLESDGKIKPGLCINLGMRVGFAVRR